MELNYKNNIIKNLFINILLKKGLKINSEKILKKILIKLKKIIKKKPNIILKNLIKNLSPKIKIIEISKKKKWKNKKNYLFIFLKKDKQIKISIKWLFSNLKFKSKLDLENIIQEIIQIYINKGQIINFKKNYYKEIKKLKNFY
jgi:ribosomal protein S7